MDGEAPAPDGPTLLEIGRVVRPHGIRGEVVVALTTDRTERLEPGTVLQGPDGPLEVRSSRPHQQRWLVKFAGVERREDGDALRNAVLRAEPLDEPDTLWVHELVGSEVVEADGTSRGTVTALQDNPASDLLVLDTGHLVPLDFVVGSEPGRVVVEVPDGLWDL